MERARDGGISLLISATMAFCYWLGGVPSGGASRADVWPPAAGAGCHPSRAIALLRALTEAAQSRLVQISGSRDDLSRDLYSRHHHDVNLVALRGQMNRPRPRRFREAPDWDSDTLDGDVEWELGRLAQAGLREVITVDLTKELFDIPVVRVVIPGLEGLHEIPGYVPGRRARELAAARA